MRDIYSLTITNEIDAERIEIHEQVEGGTINGAVEITRDNRILTISNLGTEDEETGDLDIEGYQSSQRWANDPEDPIFAEDFDDTEDGVLATIKAFLA